jgi:hypothetical protein
MLGLLITAAVATAPMPSKLHASKVLVLRGGGSVPAELVVQTTQVLFGGYAALLLVTPSLVSFSRDA